MSKVTRVCKTCSSIFEIYASALRSSNASGNFCSRPCYNQYLKTRTGTKNNNYSKIETACDCCGKKILVIPAKMRIYRTHYCSTECRHKGHRGKLAAEKNPNWRGGYTSRAGFDAVKRELYGSTSQFCACCGTFKDVHIHHIIPYRYTKDNAPGNLIPLCRKHHMMIERLTDTIIQSREGNNFCSLKAYLNCMLRAQQDATKVVIGELWRDMNERKTKLNA